jgi:hypothetical protein
MLVEMKKASIFARQIKVSIMQNILNETLLANNHISVDCVVIGFDGEQLKVLLVKRVGEEAGVVRYVFA